MNETIQTIMHRASPRSFLPTPVEEDKLQAIVDAGLKAPSGMNRQSPRFLVVTNPEIVKKLSAMNAAVMGRDVDPFYGAPVVIAVVAKKEGTWQCDGSLAMGNMLNAAFSLGVASRWIHRAKEVFDTDEGKKMLKAYGIEDEVEGIGFCVLGYTDEKAEAKEIIPGRAVFVK